VASPSRTTIVAAVLLGVFMALTNRPAGGDEDADVLFEFDEATLTDEGEELLTETAESLREEAEGHTVVIDGHTDSIGSANYNQDLSERRAAAVVDFLAEVLSEADIEFESAGHGAEDPVARNDIAGADNPNGRAQNRRVEISVE
jgi:outer membrane protein OmpA-like peptidoglycan-associated protein